MGRLVITQNITLDGRIEMLDDWFDPADDNAELVAHTREYMPTEQAVLLGRQTFEDFRGYWPAQTDDTTGITDHLNRVRKLVVSGTLTDPDWANSEVLPDARPETIRGVIDAIEHEVVCTGSIRLAHALLSDDLVDEVRLYTYPVVQGRGRALFPDGYTRPSTTLLESRAFPGGVTFSAYALR